MSFEVILESAFFLLTPSPSCHFLFSQILLSSLAIILCSRSCHGILLWSYGHYLVDGALVTLWELAVNSSQLLVLDTKRILRIKCVHEVLSCFPLFYRNMASITVSHSNGERVRSVETLWSTPEVCMDGGILKYYDSTLELLFSKSVQRRICTT